MIADKTGAKISHIDVARRNRDSLVRVGLMVAIALGLALSAPGGLVMAVFSGLLFISAGIAAVFALFMREDAFAGHFTRWDETAALLAVSMVAGMLVGPAALERAVDHQAIGPATATDALNP